MKKFGDGMSSLAVGGTAMYVAYDKMTGKSADKILLNMLIWFINFLIMKYLFISLNKSN